jgi:hypothetical protein
MKLKIVPNDNLFIVDGLTKKGFEFSVDPNIHAVSWYDTQGEIEFKEQLVDGKIIKNANLVINDLKQFVNIIEQWKIFQEEIENDSTYDEQIYNNIKNIVYEMKVSQLSVAKIYKEKSNIVDRVEFNLTGIYDSKKFTSYFDWTLPKYEEDENFTEFNDLTEEQIIDWLKNDIPEDEMIRMKYVVAEGINKQNYSETENLTTNELPWNKVEVVNVNELPWNKVEVVNVSEEIV